VHETSHNRQGRDTGVSPPAAATTATPWLRYCTIDYWMILLTSHFHNQNSRIDIAHSRFDNVDLTTLALLCKCVIYLWRLQAYYHFPNYVVQTVVLPHIYRVARNK